SRSRREQRCRHQRRGCCDLGAGGSTPDKLLTATGSVTGSGGVSIFGGIPGAGGAATAAGGTGGTGSAACPAGGHGGAMGATGGQGGNALLKDESSNLIANGANGGSIEFDGGNGGNG